MIQTMWFSDHSAAVEVPFPMPQQWAAGYILKQTVHSIIPASSNTQRTRVWKYRKVQRETSKSLRAFCTNFLREMKVANWLWGCAMILSPSSYFHSLLYVSLSWTHQEIMNHIILSSSGEDWSLCVYWNHMPQCRMCLSFSSIIFTSALLDNTFATCCVKGLKCIKDWHLLSFKVRLVTLEFFQ